MSSYTRVEISVGAFVFAGLLAVAYLSLSIGGLEVFRGDRVAIHARFASVGDLGPNATVRIAGVKVGRVARVSLVDYLAEVEMSIDAGVPIPDDTIASIRTEGLLGQSYISLSPGASETNLGPGGRIPQTEPAIDLLEILSRYAFEREGDRGGSSNLEDPL